MKLIWKLLIAVIANGVGLWLAARFIHGFVLSPDWKHVLIVGAVLTVLNIIVRPVLKLVLGPVIILTLGLGTIFVNAIVLYILDILSKHLTIDSVVTLLLATLVLSATNIVFHILTR